MLRGGNACEPVLVDYGLVRRVAKDVSASYEEDYFGLQRTYSGNVGTPGFEAPEVLQSTMKMNGVVTQGYNLPGFIKVCNNDIWHQFSHHDNSLT